MGYFGKSFEEKEAAREIRKQNRLKKKGIKVNEKDGSAADERNMLKQNRKEKIGNFFNTVSNARKRSFSNKMDRKLIKADTKNKIAQIEGHDNVAAKNTSRAMDIQIMRDTDRAKVKVNVNKSVDNSVNQMDNSSTVENTTISKPNAQKTGMTKPTGSSQGKPSVEYKPLEPTKRNQGELVKEIEPDFDYKEPKMPEPRKPEQL